MATSRELRPDGRAVQAPAKPSPERTAERKADGKTAAKDGGSSLEPEAAASLQSSWGNELLQQVTGGQRAGQAGTSSASGAPGGGSALQEVGAEEKEEVRETETDLESTRGNQAAAVGGGFASAPPPGGGPEQEAPWSMGRWFGGDDEPGDAPVRAPLARWSAPSLLLEADEAPPSEGAEAEDGSSEGVDLGAARAALGEGTIPPGFLNRGLRNAATLCSPDAEPAMLGGLAPYSPLPRAREAARFLAQHGPPAAVGIARVAAAAGGLLISPGGGLVEATARALAWTELIFAATADRARWEALAEIAVDSSSRPRAELAAASTRVGELWGAVELFLRAAEVTEPVQEAPFSEAPLSGGPLSETRRPPEPPVEEPALAGSGFGGRLLTPWECPSSPAEAALWRVACPCELPEVVRPLADGPPLGANPLADPFAELFRELTGGRDSTPLGFDAVLDGWNRLLAAFGETHVEVAAVALAARRVVPLGRLVRRLRRFQEGLRRVVGAAVRTGEAAERSGDRAMHELACDSFESARGVAELARVEAVRGIAAEVEAALRDVDARAVAEPPPPSPSALLPLLSAFEGGRDPVLALADDSGLEPLEALYVRTLRAAAALRDGQPHAAWESAAEVVERAAEAGLPFVLAEGALVAARVLRDAGEPIEDALVPVAAGLREAGEGGALQLLLAFWAESATLR